MESLVCLALAVLVFRAFHLEGYMISTGSMAPYLLGFHKRVKCPTCDYHFAFGISQNGGDSASLTLSDPPLESAPNSSPPPDRAELTPTLSRKTLARRTLAVCPNCGRDSIDVSEIPRNQGDQLLVHKNAYLFAPPKRWEVVVFRNPHQPSQAYVKRAVGLPGETIQVIDGNVHLFQDGQFRICRKSLLTQRAIRIPVYDHDYEPHDDPVWQPRWVPQSSETAWTPINQGFEFDDLSQGESDPTHPMSWIGYRHWIRSGGSHRTSVSLDATESDLQIPQSLLHPLQYNPATQTLSCYGAMSDSQRDQLLATTDDEHFQQAVQALYSSSHVAPITDQCSYNRASRSESPQAVRDLMLSTEVIVSSGKGRFVLQATDGKQTFSCNIDIGRGEVRLFIDQEKQAVRVTQLNPAVFQQPMLWEMSLMDRQILVAINGQQAFEPVLLDESKWTTEAPRTPVRLGAEGLHVQFRSIKLYRDVFYTGKGTGKPCSLKDDEYYVLGDNSPVSYDSRVWEYPAVKKSLFLGKPFVVHLPSRPGQIKIGQTLVQIRIPDISRIHYIR